MQNQSSSSILVIFILLAAMLTLVECVDLNKDIQARNWPTSKGDISWEYSATPIPSTDQFDGPMLLPIRATKEILITYEVNGLKYTSRNKSFGFTFSEDIELISSNGAGHGKVKVYYNRYNPSEAVVIPGPKLLNILTIIFGGFSLVWLLRQVIKQKMHN
jgi:hypothetical protein